MDVADLLPLADERGRITCRTLTVMATSAVTGQNVLVRQGILAGRLLTAVRETEAHWDILNTVLGPSTITPDNPFINDRARRKLDPSGLMPEGTVLEPGDVIFSAYRCLSPQRPLLSHRQPEPPPGMRWAEDWSGRIPTGWEHATLTTISRRDPGPPRPHGVAERIEATLRAEDDLAVGDPVLVEHALVAVVAGFVPDAEMPDVDGTRPDVLVSLSLGDRLNLREGGRRRFDVSRLPHRAADALQVYGEGPRSLITSQPLGRGPAAPQQITVAQVRWLRSRGFDANVAELVSLKSDDWRSLVQPGPELPGLHGSPESLWLFRAYLIALGFEVELRPAGGVVELTVRPATTERILASCGGEVRKPETINYRTYEDEPKGLFCPDIFGPSSHTRRRRFGHVKLPVPVVSPLWRQGSPSVLERLLGLSAAQIESILAHTHAVRRTESGIELVDLAPINWRMDTLAGEGFLGTGAAAVQGMLGELPRDRLPPGLADRPGALVLEVVPVLPPDYRPLVLLDNGNFATSDLNDLYRRLINRANRLKKLHELRAPEVILHNEARMLQGTVDALFANCLHSEREAVMGSRDRRLVDLLSLLRSNLTSERPKRVSRSGRACAIEDGSVRPDEVRVPRRLFETLSLQISPTVLLTNPDDDRGVFIALRATIHDEDVLRLSPAAFAGLSFSPHRVAVCAIHQPVSEAVQREAEVLRRGDPGERRAVSQNTGWIDATEHEAIIAGLCDAALQASTVRLESPRGLLLAGPGVVDDPRDGPLADRPTDVQAVPVTPSPDPPRRRRRRS